MEMRPVTSTNIAQIGYDPVRKLARVTFKNGTEYEYAGVESEDFDRLATAPSVGTHFNANFRSKYTATLVAGTRGRAPQPPDAVSEQGRTKGGRPAADQLQLPRALTDQTARRDGRPKVVGSDGMVRVAARRALEVAVLEAAVRWREAHPLKGAKDGVDVEADALCKTIDAYVKEEKPR